MGGWGFRSDRAGLAALGEAFGRPVVAARQVDERFYHTDTCFCPLGHGGPSSTPRPSRPGDRGRLLDHLPDALLLDGRRRSPSCANSVVIGDTVLHRRVPAPGGAGYLEGFGLAVETVEMGEFHKSGGSVRCLTLPLDVPGAPTVTDLGAARHGAIARPTRLARPPPRNLGGARPCWRRRRPTAPTTTCPCDVVLGVGRGRLGHRRRGPQLPRPPLGLLGAELRAPPPPPGGRGAAPARPPHPHQPGVPQRPARPVLRRAGRAVRRRRGGAAHEHRRRGGGDRHQGGPPVGLRARGVAGRRGRDRHVRRQLPRPHHDHRVVLRPTRRPGGASAPSPPASCAVPFGDADAVARGGEPQHRGRARRADPGRGRRDRAAARLPAPACGSYCDRGRAAAGGRRDPVRPRPHRDHVRLRPRGRSRPDLYVLGKALGGGLVARLGRGRPLATSSG